MGLLDLKPSEWAGAIHSGIFAGMPSWVARFYSLGSLVHVIRVESEGEIQDALWSYTGPLDKIVLTRREGNTKTVSTTRFH